ncbi:MAG: hypothetical protein FWF10_08955 [Clostridiales bacterium]|nr:hypothetical protein [Clostridiales bacterium]
MKRLFRKSFLKSRAAVSISLLLLAAATAALAMGISLYHTARSAADAARERFHALPMVDMRFGGTEDVVEDPLCAELLRQRRLPHPAREPVPNRRRTLPNLPQSTRARLYGG